MELKHCYLVSMGMNKMSKEYYMHVPLGSLVRDKSVRQKTKIQQLKREIKSSKSADNKVMNKAFKWLR